MDHFSNPNMAVGSCAAIEFEFEIDPTVNLAMQQNDVPILKLLRVKNRTETEIKDVLVRVWSEPAFAEPWESRIALIPPEGSYSLGLVPLELSPQFLMEITERVAGMVHVQALTGDRVLAEKSRHIEVLAYDEWSGLRSLPEILAAFVLPNHPSVEKILSGAATVLAQWNGDGALCGYQRKDPKYALSLVAAIYVALQQQSIRYINPPASFEMMGQKIRLPDRILENGLGTCLDLAVLAAACIEQVGLHPLVVLIQGHAFAGAWLVEECFADSATDDPLRLRKRVELGEICVFETTLLTAQPPQDFTQSVESGRRHLLDTGDFRCVIDVKRTRKGRIRPLPVRVAGGAVTEESASQPNDAMGLSVPSAVTTFVPAEAIQSPCDAPQPETPETRLDRWRRKLLDLSLNNRLLNYRETKKTLRILCPGLDSLEDALADGEKFQVHPRLEDLGEGQPRDAELHLVRTGSVALDEILKEEFQAKRLHAEVTQTELSRRMLDIFRDARTSLEEGGANTLFLALGFLAWYESESSSQRRLAPLILIPLEIERRSVMEGFRIKQADEEPRVNTSLIEMLAKDFELLVPGMDSIPRDDHGIDVRKVISTFQQSVLRVDRWEVVEEASIGLFSFAKFLMWRDLEARSEELMRNKVVSHLINKPTEAFPVDGKFPDPDRLDQTHKPDDTFCPLSADSSQLAAVYAAAEGKTFVLEGPPGTGKSQTITNLIAHSLAAGKTILFVSEKMAALSVVHARLVRCGLEPFCLELHSSKSRKLEVIKQLGQALEQTGNHSPDEWQREAERLASLRLELNGYVHALHAIRSIGESVFQGTSRVIGLRDVRRVALSWPLPDSVNRSDLDHMREMVSRMQTAGQACGHPSGNAWTGIGCEEWSPTLEREVVLALEAGLLGCETLGKSAKNVEALFAFGVEEPSWADLQFYDELARCLLESPVPPLALLTEPDWNSTRATIAEWLAHGRRRDGLRKELHAKYAPEVKDLDAEGLTSRLRESEACWALPRWLKQRGVRSELKRVYLAKRAPAREEVAHDLQKIQELREEERFISAADERAGTLLGRLWQDGEADWDRVEPVIDWCSTLRSLAWRLAGIDADKAVRLIATWGRLASEGRDQLQPEGPLGRILIAFREAFSRFGEAKSALKAKLALDEGLIGVQEQPLSLARLVSRLKAWQGSIQDFQAWCHWRSVRRHAVACNLGPLVEAFERDGLPAADLMWIFDRSFYHWWIDAVTDTEPVLRKFFSPEFERKIEQFRDVDERYTQLAKSEIQARLRSRVPSPGIKLNDNSEMGILRNQLQRQRGHMPIRSLLQRVPNLLTRLKPCLLMSPMSVAQYLDPAHPPFDLVVFDEASQIPTWDAVGAIARGQEAVVVGDPKQLPPTNFFGRIDDDGTFDDDVVEDLESILSDCLAAQLPWLQLRWHYRSRHESLIAFSNYHYYENRLLTFPSPHASLGVAFRRVADGVYDKGKSRTNRKEADAVVAEVLRRLNDPELSSQSIGIVTFSMTQQTLVEDLLEEARRKDPALDAHFGNDIHEPVFVKNLENVQGDERDVILFSICYGPDAEGRVSMNFGPLNRDGGERRLNVAVTRARREVVVFSTLGADQIDLARTRARGVKDLKCFLDYAERGFVAIAEATSLDTAADFDSPFERQVCEALRSKGHVVHPQVGCSGYRIDLAVADPEAQGRYLLGIECDGANYHRAKTARDRDRLRESVLRDLGWEIYRIWSTDWWKNPEQVLAKLEASIERARRNRLQVDQQRATVRVEGREELVQAAPLQATPDMTAGQKSPPIQTDQHVVGPEAENRLPVYEPYRTVSMLNRLGSQEEFYHPPTRHSIINLIKNVVNHEGPISLPLASRRVAAYWEFTRLTEKVQTRIASLVQQAGIKSVKISGRAFLWPDGTDPSIYAGFRVNGSSIEAQRDPVDLPPEEVASAAFFILEQQIAMPIPDLIRDTARLFGYLRTGQNVEKFIRLGIEMLVRRGHVREEEGSVVIITSSTRACGSGV